MHNEKPLLAFVPIYVSVGTKSLPKKAEPDKVERY
jgi:hypothetical protein